MDPLLGKNQSFAENRETPNGKNGNNSFQKKNRNFSRNNDSISPFSPWNKAISEDKSPPLDATVEKIFKEQFSEFSSNSPSPILFESDFSDSSPESRPLGFSLSFDSSEDSSSMVPSSPDLSPMIGYLPYHNIPHLPPHPLLTVSFPHRSEEKGFSLSQVERKVDLLSHTIPVTKNNKKPYFPTSSLSIEKLPEDLGSIDLETFLDRLKSNLHKAGLTILDDRVTGSGANAVIFGNIPVTKLRDIDLAIYLLPPLYPYEEESYLNVAKEQFIKTLFSCLDPEYQKGLISFASPNSTNIGHFQAFQLLENYYLNNRKRVLSDKRAWSLLGFGNVEIRFTLREEREWSTSAYSFQCSLETNHYYCLYGDREKAKEHYVTKTFATLSPEKIPHAFQRMLYEMKRFTHFPREEIVPFCENEILNEGIESVIKDLKNHLDPLDFQQKTRDLFILLDAIVHSEKLTSEMQGKDYIRFLSLLFSEKREKQSPIIPLIRHLLKIKDFDSLFFLFSILLENIPKESWEKECESQESQQLITNALLYLIRSTDKNAGIRDEKKTSLPLAFEFFKKYPSLLTKEGKELLFLEGSSLLCEKEISEPLGFDFIKEFLFFPLRQTIFSPPPSSSKKKRAQVKESLESRFITQGVQFFQEHGYLEEASSLLLSASKEIRSQIGPRIIPLYQNLLTSKNPRIMEVIEMISHHGPFLSDKKYREKNLSLLFSLLEEWLAPDSSEEERIRKCEKTIHSCRQLLTFSPERLARVEEELFTLKGKEIHTREGLLSFLSSIEKEISLNKQNKKSKEIQLSLALDQIEKNFSLLSMEDFETIFSFLASLSIHVDEGGISKGKRCIEKMLFAKRGYIGTNEEHLSDLLRFEKRALESRFFTPLDGVKRKLSLISYLIDSGNISFILEAKKMLFSLSLKKIKPFDPAIVIGLTHTIEKAISILLDASFEYGEDIKPLIQLDYDLRIKVRNSLQARKNEGIETSSSDSSSISSVNIFWQDILHKIEEKEKRCEGTDGSLDKKAKKSQNALLGQLFSLAEKEGLFWVEEKTPDTSASPSSSPPQGSHLNGREFSWIEAYLPYAKKEETTPSFTLSLKTIEKIAKTADTKTKKNLFEYLCYGYKRILSDKQASIHIASEWVETIINTGLLEKSFLEIHLELMEEMIKTASLSQSIPFFIQIDPLIEEEKASISMPEYPQKRENLKIAALERIKTAEDFQVLLSLYSQSRSPKSSKEDKKFLISLVDVIHFYEERFMLDLSDRLKASSEDSTTSSVEKTENSPQAELPIENAPKTVIEALSEKSSSTDSIKSGKKSLSVTIEGKTKKTRNKKEKMQEKSAHLSPKDHLLTLFEVLRESDYWKISMKKEEKKELFFSLIGKISQDDSSIDLVLDLVKKSFVKEKDFYPPAFKKEEYETTVSDVLQIPCRNFSHLKKMKELLVEIEERTEQADIPMSTMRKLHSLYVDKIEYVLSHPENETEENLLQTLIFIIHSWFFMEKNNRFGTLNESMEQIAFIRSYYENHFNSKLEFNKTFFHSLSGKFANDVTLFSQEYHSKVGLPTFLPESNSILYPSPTLFLKNLHYLTMIKHLKRWFDEEVLLENDEKTKYDPGRSYRKIEYINKVATAYFLKEDDLNENFYHILGNDYVMKIAAWTKQHNLYFAMPELDEKTGLYSYYPPNRFIDNLQTLLFMKLFSDPEIAEGNLMFINNIS